MARPESVTRIVSLDSLRGISALLVVCYHCTMAIPGLRDRVAATIVLLPFVLGPSAVLVFFALSGFVLYLTFEASDRFVYTTYIIKRFARIYPPLAAAILASAGLYLLIEPRPTPELSDWFNGSSWQIYPTLTVLLGHLALLDGGINQGLDNVIWSLVHEVRISIIFPLIALCVRRHWPATIIATLAMTVFARRYDLSAGSTFDLVATSQYVFLFAAGATLASKAATLQRWGEQPSGWWFGAATLAIGAVLISQTLTISAIATSIGAVCLVAASFAHPPTRRALSVAPLIWLGRVSYSLYLIHLLILLVLVHGLHGIVPVPVLIILVLPVSLFLAEPVYRFVELPSIQLGRNLARHIMRRAQAPSIQPDI